MTEEGTAHAPGEPRVERALEHIRTLLIPGETLEAWAIQRRVFALTRRRTIVLATSGRFIGVQRRILGGFRPVDVRWQDLKEIGLYVGTFGADLNLSAFGSSDRAVESVASRSLAFRGLRKDQAQQVYRNCQSYEQQWREKRRVRELEELRAQSGGVQIGSALQAALPAGEGEGGNSVKRLQQAKEMLAAGLISDAEYEAIKARVINAV